LGRCGLLLPSLPRQGKAAAKGSFTGGKAAQVPRPVVQHCLKPLSLVTTHHSRESGGMADALASGASARKGVGVQLPPLASYVSIFPLHFSSSWSAWVPVFSAGKPKPPCGKSWLWPPPTGRVGTGTPLGPGLSGCFMVLATFGEMLCHSALPCPETAATPWAFTVVGQPPPPRSHQPAVGPCTNRHIATVKYRKTQY
jgi:hypothetical protein